MLGSQFIFNSRLEYKLLILTYLFYSYEIIITNPTSSPTRKFSFVLILVILHYIATIDILSKPFCVNIRISSILFEPIDSSFDSYLLIRTLIRALIRAYHILRYSFSHTIYRLYFVPYLKANILPPIEQTCQEQIYALTTGVNQYHCASTKCT